MKSECKEFAFGVEAVKGAGGQTGGGEKGVARDRLEGMNTQNLRSKMIVCLAVYFWDAASDGLGGGDTVGGIVRVLRGAGGGRCQVTGNTRRLKKLEKISQ